MKKTTLNFLAISLAGHTIAQPARLVLLSSNFKR
jgi:hypothetical protein